MLLISTVALVATLGSIGATAAPNKLHSQRANQPKQNVPRYSGPPKYTVNQERADAVKQAFQISWDGYSKYAFPHDSLRPVKNRYYDDRNGWGASAIDAISTALVMKNWDAVEQIVQYIPKIDFSKTTDDVSLFETTIRYLGGLLSAYDLMSANATGHTFAPSDLSAILEQAVHLADNLKVAFDTPSGVPDNDLRFDPPRRVGSETNGLATIGTLVLEWTRLSDLTGNPEYAKLAQRGEGYLLDPQPRELGEPFPGLLGTDVNITTGKFVDGSGGWGGGDDSFYEYLIKMYLYDPVRFPTYRDRWTAAVDSSIKYLVSHPTSRPDLTYLAMWDNQTLQFYGEHLACFNGGNFILGGILLDRPEYITFGLELVDSCRNTYISTSTNIGPETFRWQDSRTPLNASNNPAPPSGMKDFYAASGFWIDSPNYVLRPEVIESYYYAYRATGDAKYQEWAWDAFLAINGTCRVGSGYSSVNDVNAPLGGGFSDFQESFWFAEVLKYSYLIHAEDAVWQVQANPGGNEFVYNTECHPIRVARGGKP
ncbi:glycoside hydrolase family 47 protein [Echria macrotheca]|uniref:alpha-1,2-Mannosidase n=1 Tax=Echria macrotheca TaxID=438768 RepID=A0AAJ0BMH7_9PEZI|nr:glycoside hydrolase family 47 protein [Echria macrotheca]